MKPAHNGLTRSDLEAAALVTLLLLAFILI